MKFIAFILLFFSSLPFEAFGLDLQEMNVNISKEAMFTGEFSEWNAVLNVIYGRRIRTEPESSQPLDYINKLVDGVYADFIGLPGTSFLVFDGPKAFIRLTVPDWHEIGTLKFGAGEIKGQKLPQVSIRHLRKDGKTVSIPIQRKFIKSKGRLEVYEYSTTPEDAGIQGGEISIRYDNGELGFAFLDEITIDSLGEPRAPTSVN